LQFCVLDADSESRCHSGSAFSEWLTPGQSNPPAVLLRSDSQGSFETFIALVSHHDPSSHVAEDLAPVGSAIDDDVPDRIDFCPQAPYGERPLR
jgi:hypothetical protein